MTVAIPFYQNGIDWNVSCPGFSARVVDNTGERLLLRGLLSVEDVPHPVNRTLVLRKGDTMIETPLQIIAKATWVSKPSEVTLDLISHKEHASTASVHTLTPEDMRITSVPKGLDAREASWPPRLGTDRRSCRTHYRFFTVPRRRKPSQGPPLRHPGRCHRTRAQRPRPSVERS